MTSQYVTQDLRILWNSLNLGIYQNWRSLEDPSILLGTYDISSNYGTAFMRVLATVLIPSLKLNSRTCDGDMCSDAMAIPFLPLWSGHDVPFTIRNPIGNFHSHRNSTGQIFDALQTMELNRVKNKACLLTHVGHIRAVCTGSLHCQPGLQHLCCRWSMS